MKRRISVLLMLLAMLFMGNAWASSYYYATLTAKVADSDKTKGKVFISDGQTLDETAFANAPKSVKVDAGEAGKNSTFYAWARPARGYKFTGWTIPADVSVNQNNNGVKDRIYAKASSEDGGEIKYTITATWSEIPVYNVTYQKPAESAYSYHADYEYYVVTADKEKIELSTDEQHIVHDEDIVVPSYTSDEIKLSVLGANASKFVAWYETKEGGSETKLSTSSTYTYHLTKNATIRAEFLPVPMIDVTYLAPIGEGSYTVYYSDGEHEVRVGDADWQQSCKGVSVKAHAADGYRFFCWYTVDGSGNKTKISYDEDGAFSYDENTTIGAWFVPENQAIFRVGDVLFADLNDANTYALTQSSSKRLIVLDHEGVLPAGDYTVSTSVALLIPYGLAQTAIQTKPLVVTAKSTLSAYKTLQFEDGTNLQVNGTLNVGGQMMSAGGGNASAYVTGTCGVIDLSKGGHIEMRSGSVLYCWGYITGQDQFHGNNTRDVGTITAKSGATVWEYFSVGDWRGGSATSDFYFNSDEWRFFPFQSYSIHNIEAPITFEYGSIEKNYINIYGGGGTNEADFVLIGSSDALFKLNDSKSFVTKWYDATTDLTCYELSGTASIDELKLDVMGTDLNSSDYNLPINNNMHIILRDCDMQMTSPMIIQAGAVMEIKQDASLTITSNIYVYDTDDWGMYMNKVYFRSFPHITSHANRGDEKVNTLSDAVFIVDGRLTVTNTGNLYTSTGGASILGNGGGVIDIQGYIPSETTIVQCTGVSAREDSPMYPAKLYNENNTYTATINKTTFYNVHGRWYKSADKDEKTNHTYSFTYLSDGASGSNLVTPAVYTVNMADYGWWTNVAQDGTCTNNWNDASGNGDIYYYDTSASKWLQMQKTETENVYGGSNNNLYMPDGCGWASMGETDDDCLYTIDGVKKALIDGRFIVVAANTADEAWHDAADETAYYLCFVGCQWHSATPVDGSPKAYDVDGVVYIWKDGDWLMTDGGDSPFFYTINDKNLKDYWMYSEAAGEWVEATPRVSVVGENESMSFLFWEDAITYSGTVINPVVTVLADIHDVKTAATITPISKSQRVTIDLNGHVVESSAAKTIAFNGPGKTLTITDNSAEKNGQIRVVYDSGVETDFAVVLTAGTLNMEAGTIYAENVNTGSKARSACVYVTGGYEFNLRGGTLEAFSPAAYAYGVYGLANSTVNMYEGTAIHVRTTTSTAYGMLAYGNTTIYGGTIEANAGTTTAYALYASSVGAQLTIHDGTFSAEAGKSTASGVQIAKDATLTVLGGTFSATANSTGLTKAGDVNVYGINLGAATTNKAVIKNATLLATERNNYGKTVVGLRTVAGTNVEVEDCTIQCSSDYQYVYGVLAAGTLAMTNCDVVAEAKSTTVHGYRQTNNTAIISNSTITAIGSGTVYGVTASATADATLAHGVINLTNTDVTSRTKSSTKSYALYVDCKAATVEEVDYATAGEITVNGGAIAAESSSTTAYAIYAVAEATAGSATATPTVVVNDGKFRVSGSSPREMINTESPVSTITLNGGYYSLDNNLSYNVAPHTGVIPTTDELLKEDYPYHIGEAYTIRFVNYDDTELWSGVVAAGETPVYPSEIDYPTKPSDVDYAYNFSGWDPSLAPASADVTYTAVFTPIFINTQVEVTPAGGVAQEPTTWANALANLKAGDTFKLLQNIGGLSTAQTISQSMTLDLNGYELSGTANNMITVNGTGVVVDIVDNSAEKRGKIVTVASGNTNTFALTLTKGTVNMYAGTIWGQNSSLSADNTDKRGYAVSVAASQTFNLYDGVIKSTASDGYAYGVRTAGTFNMTGGEINTYSEGTYAYSLFVIGGTANITGGDINATAEVSYAVGIYQASAAATIKVADATVYAKANGVGLKAAGAAQARGIYFNYDNASSKLYIYSGATIIAESDPKLGQYALGVQIAKAKPSMYVYDGAYIEGKGAYQYNYGISNAGKAYIYGGTIKASRSEEVVNNRYCYGIVNSATLQMTDVSGTGPSTAHIIVNSGSRDTYGINSSAAFTMNGVTVDVTNTNTGYATFGVYLSNKAATIKNSTINVSGNQVVYGIDATCTAAATVKSAEFTLGEGNKVSAVGNSASKVYAVFANAVTATGPYAAATKITIDGGEYEARNTSSGEAYAVYTPGTATLDEASATADVTINAGKFKASGNGGATADAISVTGTEAIRIAGGYYDQDTNLADYIVSGKRKKTLESGDEYDEGYRYRVVTLYEVVFQNENGDELQRTIEEEDATPAYTGATPTKESTVQYDYTFNGWTPTIVPVSDNATYTATYDETVRSYTITWVDEDGTSILDEQVLPYGATPVFAGAEPTKEGYIFDGWTPEIESVTGSATYVAVYKEEVRGVAEVIPAGGGEGTPYATWTEAVTAANAKAGCTLRLLDDITDLAASSVLTNTLTLDLNGHELSGTVTKLINVNGSGKSVTIIDESMEQTGLISTQVDGNARCYCIYITAGTLNIEGGTIRATNEAEYVKSTAEKTQATAVYVTAKYTCNVRGGRLEAFSTYAPYGLQVAGSATASSRAKAYVTGGEIYAEATQVTEAAGIYDLGIVEMSGGTVTAKTKTTTARGVYVAASTSKYAGTFTMTGGTVNSFTTTTTAHGVSVAVATASGKSYAGQAYIQGGEIIATAGTKTAYGVYVGFVGIGGAANTTADPKYYYYTSIGYAKATISGGTITAKTASVNGSTPATDCYGVYSLGETEITGGTIIARPTTSTAYGVYSADGSIHISGNPTILAEATTKAYGAYAGHYYPSTFKLGYMGLGNLIIDGGDITARTTSTTTAYGLYVSAVSKAITTTSSGYYPNTYASYGSATVNGGAITAIAKTSTASAIYTAAPVTGIVAAKNTVEAISESETAEPVVNINGGKFKAYTNVTTAATCLTVSGTNHSVSLAGGYYGKDTNLAAYVSDGKSVMANTDEPELSNGYLYKVATADITILSGETMNIDGDLSAENITIEAGGQLVVNGNTTASNLVFVYNNNDEVGSAMLNGSFTGQSYLELQVTSANWHAIALPSNVNTADVLVDGEAGKFRQADGWYMRAFDSDEYARVGTVTNNRGGQNGWYNVSSATDAATATTMQANVGYLVGVGHDDDEIHTLRFPITLASQMVDQTVTVKAHTGVQKPLYHGWNFAGAPYASHYYTTEFNDYTIELVTYPIGGGTSFKQAWLGDVTMKPFSAYFFQVSSDINMAYKADQCVVAADVPQHLAARAQVQYAAAERPVRVTMMLTNSRGEQDETSLTLSDEFTTGYEIGKDLSKMFGSSYKGYTQPIVYTNSTNGKMAFNALPYSAAEQMIPVGFYAAESGVYTMSLNQNRNMSGVTAVMLYDTETETETNLLWDDYQFISDRQANNDSRFYLYVQRGPQVVTDMQNGGNVTSRIRKVMIDGQMYIRVGERTFDATGKMIQF